MQKQALAVTTIFILLIGAISVSYGEDNILGCYHSKNGHLRIVEDHSECKNNELPISLLGTKNQPSSPIPPHFKGLLCWDVEWEDRPNYVLKLRVSYTGGNCFILQSEGGGEFEGGHFAVFFGTAEYLKDENKIAVSIHETHGDTSPFPAQNADSSGCQYFLDATTLDGTGWCTTPYYEPSEDRYGIEYSTGTLTHTVCP